jgi:adenylate kinase family enzyme
MYELAVLGGKGGTGKTSLAGALAALALTEPSISAGTTLNGWWRWRTTSACPAWYW